MHIKINDGVTFGLRVKFGTFDEDVYNTNNKHN